ncbi:Ras-like protein 2 [Golovinomyces cichoracearum]|uniref:Ras-like protein 2 n=1 Tax=Golovinomyces cichoracearum TaxID=62708 RepID=A0A420I789_9PEZI|nr:Ras-like protein 2 [Golovinomyces cichoracearum]
MANPHITVTICGGGGTGKSSISLRLVRSIWNNIYDPTVEDTYSVTRQIDGKTYHLSIIDTAGQEEYRSMWTTSNRHSDAFLLVYDITNPKSLDALEEFSALIDQDNNEMHSRDPEQKKKGSTNKEHYPEANSGQVDGDCREVEKLQRPVKSVKLVMGNMCDLQEKRRVLPQVGQEWARAHGCGFMETSAREIFNIDEALESTIQQVMEARHKASVGEEFELKSIMKREGNKAKNRLSVHFNLVEPIKGNNSTTPLLDVFQLEDNVLNIRRNQEIIKKKDTRNSKIKIFKRQLSWIGFHLALNNTIQGKKLSCSR